jgi:hypothetical protein
MRSLQYLQNKISTQIRLKMCIFLKIQYYKRLRRNPHRLSTVCENRKFGQNVMD